MLGLLFNKICHFTAVIFTNHALLIKTSFFSSTFTIFCQLCFSFFTNTELFFRNHCISILSPLFLLFSSASCCTCRFRSVWCWSLWLWPCFYSCFTYLFLSKWRYSLNFLTTSFQSMLYSGTTCSFYLICTFICFVMYGIQKFSLL